MREPGVICLAVSFLFCTGSEVWSAEPRACADTAGALISAEGDVSYREAGEWQAAGLGQLLCDRDSVRTGANSRAAIQLADDAVLRLDENTTLVLADVAPEPEASSFLSLIVGAIESFSRRPQTLEVDTPYVNATIEGTEFVLRVEEEKATLAVLEGTVAASNNFGSVQVASGSAVVAVPGSAPQSVLFTDPIGAVEWGLYYPPVLALGAESEGTPAIGEARRLLAQDRPGDAIDLLLATPSAGEVNRVYAAALLLSVGQVDRARRILNQVLAADPGNGLALAELAVIDVVQNRNEEALATAERAVAAAPGQPAPHIALSIAQQAAFRLEDARDTLVGASGNVPDSALLWARLSELWLSLGYRDRSAVAADRAIEIDPEVARAYAMRGFAALTSFETEPALEAFGRAIELEPADPLPHLGVGLALIREGDLEAGRREIDAAVALDPTRSLLRSYLGKAYFAENRDDIAVQQFAIAKELDPDDPTPHFYESILLQTQNRPGEALGAVQRAIELNQNRAPFRSRLELDQDLAARGASLGRIYEDLGFIQLGMREATNAQLLDPANAAAHRFLADIYRNERRRELARVSELMRSQLLQDVNLYPVQPSMTETNLNLVPLGGPASPAFNEYTALFASDGFRFTGTGVIGNHDTFGGEAAAALQDDGVSVSFGGFEFTTDGFRDNFDAQHSIYDLFAQWAVTPEFNLQVEGRHRESTLGDLDLNFDPDLFRRGTEIDFEEDSVRFGARYSPDPHNDTLFSFIYGQRTLSTLEPQFPPVSAAEVFDGDGWQAELQHIYQQENFSLTVGGLFGNASDDRWIDVFGLPFPLTIPLGVTDRENRRLYAYGTADLPIPDPLGSLTLTLGVSYEAYEEEVSAVGASNDVDEVNPKAGLVWSPIDDLSIRAAYFETVKPSFVTNRTLEPTEIAGFNQFYDDVDGASTKRWGVGIDYKVNDKIFIGGEATWRRLDVPFLQVDPLTGAAAYPENDWEEATHRAYVNFLPHPRVPVSLEFIYDRFERDPSSNPTIQEAIPTEVETFSVPLTVRYFDPSGFFAGIRGAYVHQEVARDNLVLPPSTEGKSDFFNVDLVAGYRFPNERGSLTLEVQNLTNNKFNYQDDGFREFTNFGSTGPYFPELGVLGRLTINF